MRAENPLPRGTEKTKDIGTSIVFAVSNDCYLAVFDLKTGDCLGHVQTGISGNLSVTYCCEKLFVSNRSTNNIAVFIRSSKTGDPVPQTELIGHSTTVHCLHSDEVNKRLFSGSGDNSVAVWYYDRVQDTMLQIQQLKSVSKSTKFTCITTAKNINCLVAGADNGFITVWHEYDLTNDALSDKMYDLRMLIEKRNLEQKQEELRGDVDFGGINGSNQRNEISPDDDDADNHDDDDDDGGGTAEEKDTEHDTVSTAAKIQSFIQSMMADYDLTVPPSLSQQMEFIKNMNKKDISKNNLKNGSIQSKKSKSNMVWKCVYCWKAHKGAVSTVSYLEDYNMLMSTSHSGQIRLVYLCDPGKVPPMTMVPSDAIWPDHIRDKICKIFNEIQAIESTSYPHTRYQNLNLWNEYQADNESVAGDDVGKLLEDENDGKEEEIDYIDREQLEIHNKETDDLWQDDDDDDGDDVNGYFMGKNDTQHTTDEPVFNGFTPMSQDHAKLLDEASKYENASLDDLL